MTMMTMMPTLTKAALPATWFDGRSSRRHAVQIWPDGDRLVLAPPMSSPPPRPGAMP